MSGKSTYSPEAAAKILEQIRRGRSESVIGEMEGYPCSRTIRRWKEEQPDFLTATITARRESAEKYREKALSIAEAVGEYADEALKAGQDVPSGYLKAKQMLIAELNREAALRDDSRFGDRKRVAAELSADKNLVIQWSDGKDETED